MNDDQLRGALNEIREFALGNGLGWVLDELDEQAVLGIVESKRLRESRRDGKLFYEELAESPRPGLGRPRAEEFITRRRMTVREQVDALIDALERVLVGVELVAIESVKQLQELPEASALVVNVIEFMPDEDDRGPSVTTEELRYDVRSERVQGRLQQLRELIDE